MPGMPLAISDFAVRGLSVRSDKYGMLKGILSDVQLPFPNGKEVLYENWDFIVRYYLCGVLRRVEKKVVRRCYASARLSPFCFIKVI